MKNINCELLIFSNSAHLQQLYAGFQLLKKRKIIKIKHNIVKSDCYDNNHPHHLRDSNLYHLKVKLNNRLILFYDTHDSFEIDDNILENVDFYFKRSFFEEYIEHKKEKYKIFPLGMNYLVYSNRLDLCGIKRIKLDKNYYKIINFIQYTGLCKILKNMIYFPNIENCKSLPEFNANPRILFMARAWEPNPLLSKDKIREMESLNITRAKCIKLLKAEFGNQFIGGFSHDEYSKKYFKDCLLIDNEFSRKRNYMKILRTIPICISTQGLHGSNGWKLAEYVAFSKAIVSEKIKYKVSGNFEKEQNYLEFNCPEGCIESVLRLIENHQLRMRMMLNNYLYYENYLKPDALVLNSLMTARIVSGKSI